MLPQICNVLISDSKLNKFRKSAMGSIMTSPSDLRLSSNPSYVQSKEAKPGQLVGVTRRGERLVLWRDEQSRLASLADQCPHRGAALSAGKRDTSLAADPP